MHPKGHSLDHDEVQRSLKGIEANEAKENRVCIAVRQLPEPPIHEGVEDPDDERCSYGIHQ